MYPTKVVDKDSFDACLDRMYDNYVRWCRGRGSEGLVLSKEEWLIVLNMMEGETLRTLISNFNQHELSVISN